MFEHLVSVHHVSNQKNRFSKRWRFYLPMFILALVTFISASSWSQGPASRAEDLPTKISSVEVEVLDQVNPEVLVQSLNNSLFSFVLKNEQITSLHSLAISAPALINQEIFQNNLSLYEANMQLGSWEWTADNKMLFNFDNYTLSPGEHYFQLRLNNLDNTLLNQTLVFGFEKAQDIVTTDGNSFFFAKGEFPLFKNSIKVLEHSQILSYNNLDKLKYLVAMDSNALVADFSLSSRGESFAINKIDLSVDQANEKDIFYLASDGEMLTKAQVIDGHLLFQADNLVLKADDDLNLQIWGKLTEKNNYQFSLNNILAKGFLSGTDIDYAAGIILSQIETREDILHLKTDLQQGVLTQNWNSVFKARLQHNDKFPIYLHRLAWRVDNFANNIQEWSLWLNGQEYPAKFNFDKQLLVIDFAEQPLLVSSALELELLAKVNLLSDASRLQVALLPDDENSANFVWSIDQIKYNSYLLPDFPVSPVILLK